MHKRILARRAGILLGVLVLTSGVLWAQKAAERPAPPPPRGAAYQPAQEAILEGTVVSYTANSDTPPLGARLVLQTATGNIDIHLGTDAFLKASQFSLTPGDAVRVLGSVAAGRAESIFLARVIQNGSQTLAVRTAAGAPLSLAGARSTNPKASQAQEDAR